MLENIIIRMKYGILLSIFMLAILLFNQFTDRNYKSAKDFIRKNYKMNSGCGKIANINNFLGNKNGKYIFDVKWEFGCEKLVYIETNIENNKVIKYKLLTDDSDKCFYLGLVSWKYKCK